MKSIEFITETEAPIDTRNMTFAELGQKRVTIHIGELTGAVGEFLEFYDIVVDQVGFNGVARMHGKDLPRVEDAHKAVARWVDNISPVGDMGQSRYGFTFDVSNETPYQYVETLENTLRYYYSK